MSAWRHKNQVILFSFITPVLPLWVKLAAGRTTLNHHVDVSDVEVTILQFLYRTVRKRRFLWSLFSNYNTVLSCSYNLHLDCQHRPDHYLLTKSKWISPDLEGKFTTKHQRYLFGGVLLLGHHAAQLVVQRLSVVQLLDLVDPDQPVLRGERLLQVLELDVLVADLGVACSVKARRRPEVQLGGGKNAAIRLIS